jgi:hypothetical protein
MPPQPPLTLVRTDETDRGLPASREAEPTISEPSISGMRSYARAPDFTPPSELARPRFPRASGFSRAADRSAAPEPVPPAYATAPIRPDRLTVWPTEDGLFGIDVRWYGRECILRAVVVRRLLTDAGYRATAENSLDGRNWQLTVSPVPADEVADVIENFIW